MALLEFISDEDLTSEVRLLVRKTLKKRSQAEKDFTKNVVDPFGALFEAPAFSEHEAWKSSELMRQTQKTIQNHVGTFHQKILGHVAGWSDLGTGSVVDLVNHDLRILAEVKNKYSTVTGGDLSNKYYSLDGLISPKHSSFKGYTSYFVQVIPKKTERYNIPFTPSDKEKGELCTSNELIRVIDGASFYELVTGRAYALKELHQVLPEVIEKVYQEELQDTSFKFHDIPSYMEYFKLAYGE
ncbi:TPA: Eco47II family restriction endonuclease [Vibrio parahaemolyticus]|uniref:Restriction endonuclease n=1 Tax=Vibrio parahaemolyticus TaxID=670 RepID=A0AAW3IYR0_VIBPH|nr:restriction endonuclease [Vibrio parahaemolyticus]HCG8623781.1 Eco47II family restriction endonuclease [Vibrio parahaemolyticus]